MKIFREDFTVGEPFDMGRHTFTEADTVTGSAAMRLMVAA